MPAIVDLSTPVSRGMAAYPGIPGPVVSEHLSREASRDVHASGYEFHIGRIDMVVNTGTYIEAPFHWHADGHDLAALDLGRAIAIPGAGIDVPPTGATDDVVFAGHDLAAGIPIVEHLTKLDQLTGPFLVTAVPAPARGVGSFPVRAFATLAHVA